MFANLPANTDLAHLAPKRETLRNERFEEARFRANRAYERMDTVLAGIDREISETTDAIDMEEIADRAEEFARRLEGRS